MSSSPESPPPRSPRETPPPKKQTFLQQHEAIRAMCSVGWTDDPPTEPREQEDSARPTPGKSQP